MNNWYLLTRTLFLCGEDFILGIKTIVGKLVHYGILTYTGMFIKQTYRNLLPNKVFNCYLGIYRLSSEQQLDLSGCPFQ